MAKTTFNLGDILKIAFLNSIYGTGANGGHRHDGADADGHCGKINLTDGTDVEGILPASMSQGLPIGFMAPAMRSSAPTGWLLCDGGDIPVGTQYDELRVYLLEFGLTKLPGVSGRVVVGAGTLGDDTYQVGQTFGEARHTLTVPELAEHYHSVIGVSDASGNPIPNRAVDEAGTPYSGGYPYDIKGESLDQATRTGGDVPHENRQPSFAANWMIRAY